jgi:hypothetical protein
MKKKLLPVIIGALLICYNITSNAQANQTLSNLTSPTAINQSLLPKSVSVFNLGSNSKTWHRLYLDGSIYNSTSQIFSASMSDAGLNVAVGINASTIDGVYIGNYSGNNSITGLNNTTVGNYTLRNNTIGSNNVAVGAWALTSNTEGANNTAIGTHSLYTNTTGYSNTAIGYQSLYYNTTGYYNTADGYRSLYNNTKGTHNTANGRLSLYKNTTGVHNTATGYASLYSNSTGSYNTAYGYSALYSTNTATSNTAIGYATLYYNTGSSNTATGFEALYFNSKGSGNTAIGNAALYTNTGGKYNMASGYSALHANTTGSYNTAIGNLALYANGTGSYNTALGSSAGVSSDSLINATAIGYDAKVDASNKVRIGNTSVISIGGHVGWTTFSDGRYKRDIKENVPGLAFINSLRPISYTVNVKGLNEHYNTAGKAVSNNDDETANTLMQKSEEAAGRIVHNGFVAQEVEEAARKLSFEFSGVDKPQNKDGLYGLRYDNFIVPLVKAVQELSKMNEEKEAKIDGLQKQIDELKIMINSNSNSNIKTGVNLGNVLLEQNIPNPFSKTTIIGYNLPQKFTHAQIAIADKNGKIVKQVNISGSGKGSVNIDVAALPSGTYNYSLLVDGQIVGSKQMMLVK